MIRFALVLALVLCLVSTNTILAHDAEWHPGPMKSDQIDFPAIECKAVGSYQGHTYTWQYRMVGDASQANEATWLESFCHNKGVESVQGWFKYQEQLGIPVENIQVSFRHL